MCFSGIWKWYQQSHARLNDWDSAWGVSNEMEVLFYALAHCALQLKRLTFLSETHISASAISNQGSLIFSTYIAICMVIALQCTQPVQLGFWTLLISALAWVHRLQSKGSIMLPVCTAILTLWSCECLRVHSGPISWLVHDINVWFLLCLLWIRYYYDKTCHIWKATKCNQGSAVYSLLLEPTCH